MNHSGDVTEMDQEHIANWQTIRGQTSGDCLIFGDEVFIKGAVKRVRWRACHPRMDLEAFGKSDLGRGGVFYALKDADAAAEELLCCQLSK